MDTILPSPNRGWLRRHVVATLAISFAIVVLATALGLFLWVRSYAPLFVGGYGPGRGVTRMLEAPDSFPSLSPGRYALVHAGTFEYMYDVAESGRWPVTIDRIEPHFDNGAPQSIAFVRLRREWPDDPPAVEGKMRLDRRRDRQIHVTLRASCTGVPPQTYAPATTVTLHYRYLRFFSRTETIPVGDGMLLACP